MDTSYGNDVEGVVFVVDDNSLMRASIEMTLLRAGLKAVEFASAEEFLEYITPSHSGCVLVDVRMPGMSGLELQEELIRRNLTISVVIMTGYADVPLAVRAMRAGAVDILEKPFKNEALLASVRKALDVAKERSAQAAVKASILDKLAGLSDRERDVLKEIVAGHSNKEIARKLNISPRTIEVHRARIMDKMDAPNIATLVQMVSLVLLT